METMSVLLAFDEYEGDVRISHLKGDEITVPDERADQLRERGLARKKPEPRKGKGDEADDGEGTGARTDGDGDGDETPNTDPGMAE